MGLTSRQLPHSRMRQLITSPMECENIVGDTQIVGFVCVRVCALHRDAVGDTAMRCVKVNRTTACHAHKAMAQQEQETVLIC